MDKPIVCRKISEAEIPQTAQIIFDAFNKFSEEAGLPVTPEVSIVENRIREYANERGVPGVFYGAFAGDEQLGAFMLRKLGIDEESWEISMLSVKPEYQRQGIAREMLKLATSETLENRGVLMVCAVIEGNDAALNFFADNGFECEASGIPVSEEMSIWMLRKDMKNLKSAQRAKEEAIKDKEEEEKALEGMVLRPELLNAAEKCEGTIEE